MRAHEAMQKSSRLIQAKQVKSKALFVGNVPSLANHSRDKGVEQNQQTKLSRNVNGRSSYNFAQIPLERKTTPAARSEKSKGAINRLAEFGQSGSAGSLPYLEKIQTAFGHHSVREVGAFIGGNARHANMQMGSTAYTSANKISFKQSPNLHTSAHEAAHIIQQRSGLELSGGTGKPNDQHEQHADMVAEAVVTGQSAEHLLDSYIGTGPTNANQVQYQDGPELSEQEQICQDLRLQYDNSRQVIAMYRNFQAGEIDWETLQSHRVSIGNAAEGVTEAGKKLPPVVQEAIEEVESFGLEEVKHAARLMYGMTGSDDFFHQQWVLNEIERQLHLNKVLIEYMYANGCPDFPGTWQGFQEQVLAVGTKGVEQRSTIESPKETRTALAWVEIGGEDILVLATEVSKAGRLRFVRWIDSQFRELALQQASVKQGNGDCSEFCVNVITLDLSDHRSSASSSRPSKKTAN